MQKVEDAIRPAPQQRGDWLIEATALGGVIGLGVMIAGCVRSALEIGGDEHFEVIKALLWANGYSLYSQIWDDQPPLFTVLLGLCFRGFGSTIAVARALAVAFGTSLLLAIWVLVKRRSGGVAAFVAAGTLLSSPHVLELAVSVMQEVPAIGCALWSLWPILRWQKSRHWRWLALSGSILAVALQIKLTAAVAGLALVTEIWLDSQGATWREQTRAAMRNVIVWASSAAVAFFLLGVVLGGESWSQLWRSHFSPGVVAASSQVRNLAFAPMLVLDHTEVVWAAGAALILVLYWRDWRRMAFPLVWLLTASLIHLIHRPWWSFYYLHFAVPLAWLTGYSIAAVFRIAWTKAADGFLQPPFTATVCLVAGSGLVALVITYGGNRLLCETEILRALPRVEEEPLVAKMKTYVPHTHWVFTRQTMFPFHAGLLVPPELAVLSMKRFWSGQIDNERIVATVKRYHPEQLLLENPPLDSSLQKYVAARYKLVYQNTRYSLYVIESLVVPNNR